MTRDVLRTAHRLYEAREVSYDLGLNVHLALPKADGKSGATDTAHFKLEPELIISLLEGSFRQPNVESDAYFSRSVYKAWQAYAG